MESDPIANVFELASAARKIHLQFIRENDVSEEGAYTKSKVQISRPWALGRWTYRGRLHLTRLRGQKHPLLMDEYQLRTWTKSVIESQVPSGGALGSVKDIAFNSPPEKTADSVTLNVTIRFRLCPYVLCRKKDEDGLFLHVGGKEAPVSDGEHSLVASFDFQEQMRGLDLLAPQLEWSAAQLLDAGENTRIWNLNALRASACIADRTIYDPELGYRDEPPPGTRPG